jgi:5-methylcytosine-specific restriction endonuclease McrA
VQAEIILRQAGRCADCGTKLALNAIVFDHRPPIALREAGDDVNDPDRLAAVCQQCHSEKPPET